MNLNNLWMVVAVAALLSLFFGYGFGWFEWGRKLKAYEADERQKTAEEKKEPAPPRPIQQEEPALLVLRNIKGRLRLELEGHPLEADSLSAEQRKRLIDVVSRLRPWIDPRPASAPTPVPVPAPKTIPAAVAPPPQPVSVPVKKEEAQAPQSMVAQINEILQKNMLGTPLEKMGIKLAETPGGGVTVTVGLNRYESIGEVPSLEIQTAIRVAISEWEKKYTPG